jgi:ABC-type hemin transport system ATPase subunit
MEATGRTVHRAEGPTVLRDITMQIPVGKLLVVVGDVGAGKSSLLAAMLSEMHVMGVRCAWLFCSTPLPSRGGFPHCRTPFLLNVQL